MGVSLGLSTCREKHSCGLSVFEKRNMRIFGLKKKGKNEK